MILYFSGTGNSQHLAQIISRQTQDEMTDMSVLMNNGIRQISLKPDETLGFVFPTHFWGVPAIVREFLNQVEINNYNNQYTFAATTYGMICGNPTGQLRSLLLAKGITLQGAFNVRMVDVWTPIFNLSDKEKSLRTTQKAIPQMQEIARKVTEKTQGEFLSRNLPSIVNGLHRILYLNHRPTAAFRITDSCIGCGLCASSCPTRAITMEDRHPRWTHAECTLCLKCLHHCPQFAIQYGAFTHKHGQFVNPYIE